MCGKRGEPPASYLCEPERMSSALNIVNDCQNNIKRMGSARGIIGTAC